jgi:hypothetical protein
MPFWLVRTRCTTLNHSRSGLLVFSKMIPATREKRQEVTVAHLEVPDNRLRETLELAL